MADRPRLPGPPDDLPASPSPTDRNTPVVDAQRTFDRPNWREQYAKDGRVTAEVWDAMSITPYRERLDTPDRIGSDGAADTPRDALARFDPRRAGLDDITAGEAAEYLAGADLTERPWLSTARRASPEAQRVLAALDRGGGHALERHEGSIMPTDTDARAAKLIDPAVPDPADRAPGKDAYRSGRHACGIDATALIDPDAFAVAYARATEHPDVHPSLDQAYGPDYRPDPVDVPLDDLLGAGCSQYCAGNRLDAIDGDIDLAQDNRKEWVKDMRAGQTPAAPEPTATAHKRDAFEGATLHLAFRPNRDRTGYEVTTMYVNPRGDQPKEPAS